MRTKSVALIAAAASAVAAGITSKSQAQTYTYYRPVVSVVGDGTTADTTQFGATTTIQAFNYAPSSMTGIGATNQATPIAAFAYASNGTGSSLLTTANSSTEGDLENNPALDDAATAGLPYSGTAYVFSGGYQGTDGQANINSAATAANRMVGYMSVTGNFVSTGTIGSSTTEVATAGTAPTNGTYSGGNFRSAVGDDTPSDGNFWMAGTGVSNTTAGFTASFRYTNVNTIGSASSELTTSAANNRRVQIRAGQLYGSADTGNFTGISLVNYNANPATTAGLPTGLASPGVTALFSTSLQPPNSGAVSPLSFVLMNDPNNPNTPTASVTQSVTGVNGGLPTTTSVAVPFNVAYVADDNIVNPSFAGIEKWVYNPTLAGGTAPALNYGWVMDYVIPDPKFAAGNVGLAGELVVNPADSTQDMVDLFSTDLPTSGSQNYLIQTTDQISAFTGTTAPAATTNSEVVLAESSTNDAFRGVALAPIVPITAAWNSTAGGNWTPSASWNGVGSNSTGTNASLQTESIPGAFSDLADTAEFGDVAGAGVATNVTLDTARAVGHLLFNSVATSYTISGSAALTLDDTGDNVPGAVADITSASGTQPVTISAPINLIHGVTMNAGALSTVTVSGNISGAGGLTSSGAGTVVLTGTNTYPGGTTVNAGKLVIGVAAALPSVGPVAITGGVMQLTDNITAGTALGTSNVNLTSLSISGNSALDIGNNRIIIDYTTGHDPIASVAAWIANGFTNGEAAGFGASIISSDVATADSASGFSYGIGYADGADGAIAGLPSGEIEIMFTLLGDANLDGQVNSEDFTPFSTNLNQNGGWDKGDFNYDGTVNAEDFTPFSHDLNQPAVYAAAAGTLELADGLSLANVPEPASMGLLAAGAMGLLARRRRQNR